MLDPPLTERGVEQCRLLQEHLRNLPIAANIGHIVTSPLRRTLKTTLLSLDWLIRQGVPVEVDAMWQGKNKTSRPRQQLTFLENSDSPCDMGSDMKTLAEEFPELDFTKVDPIFPDKSPDTPYAFTRSTNLARGQKCLAKLYGRPEKAIAVVSHSGFLRTAISKRRYANADYRVFTFRRSKGGQLSLVEDGVTAQKGGGLGRSEKGLQRIEPWDFPPEDLVAAAVGDYGEQVS